MHIQRHLKKEADIERDNATDDSFLLSWNFVSVTWERIEPFKVDLYSFTKKKKIKYLKAVLDMLIDLIFLES